LQNVDFVRVGRTDAIHPELWGHVINGPGSLSLSPEVPKNMLGTSPLLLVGIFILVFKLV
jgi:hypothetical protein